MLQYEPKAPYVRNRDSAFTVMMDVVIALLPLYFMAFYFYGLRALMLGLASIAAAVVSDFVCILLEGKKPYFRDISSVVTGMMLPLMMSAATPYYVVVSASVFAVVFVKHVFGGVGQSAFNPAAAGFAFAVACWPVQVFSYPAPFSSLEPFGTISAGLSSGPAWNLFQYWRPVCFICCSVVRSAGRHLLLFSGSWYWQCFCSPEFQKAVRCHWYMKRPQECGCSAAFSC